jgi:hypothetical protein
MRVLLIGIGTALNRGVDRVNFGDGAAIERTVPLESGYRVLARAAQKSLNSRCRPLALALPLLLCACASTPVERKGPLQQTIVKRTYSTGLQDLRSAILAKFG